MEEDVETPLGSTVTVTGELQEFMSASNPGEFDSKEYYRILKQRNNLLKEIQKNPLQN